MHDCARIYAGVCGSDGTVEVGTGKGDRCVYPRVHRHAVVCMYVCLSDKSLA